VKRAASGIQAAIARFDPDLVHFSNAGPAVYHQAVPRRCRRVATVHGNDLTAPWQTTPEKDPTSCIVEGLNACDTIFAVSRHTAGLVDRWRVTAPVIVMTSGCDLDWFRPLPDTVALTRAKYGLPPGVPLLLTVGRIVARKGHFTILNALRLMPFPVCWWVAGDGPERDRLARAVAESGMGDRVSLLGRVSNEELPLLYNACDVFVLTPEERKLSGGRLDSEGFGLVFHEAGACGKPVIGSDVSGCREAIVDGGTGLLVAAGDAPALAQAIDSLVRVPGNGLAETLARGGSTFVRGAGGWPRLARQTYEVYERLTGVVASRIEPPGMLTPL
jgi:glycosyltransferase involved in cell wall biosynthesis